jgi:hypothetical protein
MITLRRRAFVSLAAICTLTFGVSACASLFRQEQNEPMWSGTRPQTLRFENNARDNVDVYLIGEKREWHLGRVATGAIVSLRLPDDAFADGTMVRMAVLVGERMTLSAARNPRAVVTIAQPPAIIMSQRWTFSQGNLTSLQH